MQRLTKTIFLLFALTMSAACGDDGGGDDQPGPDACVGHTCPDGTGVQLTDPDGGNIIFEYIYFDTQLQAAFQLPEGVTTANRVMAYFLNSQEPNNAALPTPGVCNNLVATDGWPMYIGAERTDLDIGTLTITGPNAAGTETTTEIPKITTPGIDAIGRMHDVFYQVVNPNADDFITTDASYTVEFSGSGTLEPAKYEDAIFMANEFTVTNPDLEDDGPLVAGTDFPVEWNPTTSENLPEGDEVLGVVWLVDSNGSPTHMCPTLLSEGKFTIPGAAITEYRAAATARGANPDVMILLRNAIVHKLERLPNNEDDNKRRIDMLSVMCWAQLMNVEEAPQ